MSLNQFIYGACLESNVGIPKIEVRAAEHYGQCGEDIIVSAMIRGIAWRHKVGLEEKFYIEVGGNHPFSSSTTYLLSRRLGMNGVIVEANSALIDDIRRGRPKDIVLHGAVQNQDVKTVKLSISNASELSSVDRSFVLNWAGGSVGESEYVDVPALRANDIFGAFNRADDVIFLSIDIEGLDLDVLKDIDFNRYRPWVIQAEPSDQHIPENSRAMCEYMDSVGYALAAITNVNMIFVDARL